MTDPIYVTRPSLPPIEEFTPYLEKIWASGILTNGGPFHEQLERELAEHLGVPFVSLFNNGTSALLVALRALDLSGEVITTPFSFVATANALVWNRLKPVFVDIERDSMNLDPAKIEAAVTSRTTAIMPVHCFGRPCDWHAIGGIARRNGLKVVYDAAHAFGVTERGESILNTGDLSILSFHATKVFNTFEGGAIVCRTAEMKGRIDRLRNFGFVDETEVHVAGINGKMSELQAAFGLVQLRRIDDEIKRRGEVAARYQEHLRGVRGITLPAWPPTVRNNHSYFPILVGPDFPLTRDALYDQLKANGIWSRRYFFPLISEMKAYRTEAASLPLQTASEVAGAVLCLPIYAHLEPADQMRVIETIKGAA